MIPPLPHASSLPSPALSHLAHSLLLPFLHQHAKCAACHGPLEPPTISFLCLHSYHPACLGDYDTECLVCTPQRKRIAEHLTQQRALARGKEEALDVILKNPAVLQCGPSLDTLGPDEIKGFAVTLMIGIITSMFTAIMLTRLMISLWIKRRKPAEVPI